MSIADADGPVKVKPKGDDGWRCVENKNKKFVNEGEEGRENRCGNVVAALFDQNEPDAFKKKSCPQHHKFAHNCVGYKLTVDDEWKAFLVLTTRTKSPLADERDHR